eukprot:386729_1
MVVVLQFLLIFVASVYGTKLPPKSLGLYCLISDDTIPDYNSTANWQPELYDYIINGTNVIFLFFIDANKMPAVPVAMANLAKCKGQPGCPPTNVPVIFSIGSIKDAPVTWLKSQSSAEAMAAQVATWDKQYGADGIDLDIEGDAGSTANGGANMVFFAKKLRQLNSDFLITQPVYGYPQIDSENDIVNAGFTASGQSNGLIDSVDIMYYQDLGSLQYVSNYANGTSKPSSWPIKVNVPYENILVSIQGTAADNVIQQMANAVVQQQLGGFFVWFASVYDKTRNKPAFNYGGDDTSIAKSNAWAKALKTMTG